MFKHGRMVWGLPLVMLLAGCIGGSGGQDTSLDGGIDTGSSPGVSGPAHTLALSHPITNSIENVNGGFYRRIGKATVTDAEGRSLPDGTVIQLNVVDSIIAVGMIGNDPTDVISGNSLLDMDPTLTDGTPTTFNMASVIRTTALGSDIRFIRQNDLVLLSNLSAQADKRRFVAAVPELSNTLNVTSDYSQVYPNAVYATTEYRVTASMLGASIAGVQADGTLTPGTAVIRDGLATFHITYPANVYTIMSGCGVSAIDTRIHPAGSSQVFVVARYGDVLTAIDDSFCFSPIAGFSVIPQFEVVQISSGATIDVGVCVKDGGDQIPVPFRRIAYAKSGGDAPGSVIGLSNTIEDGFGNHYTNLNGCFTATLTAVLPGTTTPDGSSATEASATFTFVVGDGSAEIEVKVI